jgi:hypothetical protein
MSGFWDDEHWADEYFGQEFTGDYQQPAPSPGAGAPLYNSPLYFSQLYFDPYFWASFRDKVVPATPDDCPPGYWARFYWGQEFWMGQYWPSPCYHLDMGMPDPGLQEYHGSGKWLREHEADIRRKWDELLEIKRKYRERARKGWRTRKRKGLELTEYDPLLDLVQTIQEVMKVDEEMAKLAAAAVLAEAMLADELECSTEQAVVVGLQMIEV